MATNRLNALLQMDNDNTIMSLPIDKLDLFPNSPFKIYEGKKKEQLVESVRDSGIMFPIIVIPNRKSRGRYTVLSGSNRLDAAQQLGHTEINAIVRTDIETEEDALLIVIETNLFNRSIDDMLPSELAISLSLIQKPLKKQVKISDLTSGTLCQKLDNENKNNDENNKDISGTLYQTLNEEYKLSERNIRNYIRLTYLCDNLLSLVDYNIISFIAGVELSYLKQEEQILLFEIIDELHPKISIDIAKELKLLSNTVNTDSILTKEQIKAALTPIKSNGGKSKSSNFIKIPIKSIISYIKEDDLDKAQDILVEALKLYYKMNS